MLRLIKNRNNLEVPVVYSRKNVAKRVRDHVIIQMPSQLPALDNGSSNIPSHKTQQRTQQEHHYTLYSNSPHNSLCVVERFGRHWCESNYNFLIIWIKGYNIREVLRIP
ncbi:hypothetical protein CsatA_023385 [Cannabis sativa]